MVLLVEDTIKEFGYNPLELSPKSHKKVLAKCDECGKVRVLYRFAYCDLCQACSSRRIIKEYNKSDASIARKLSAARHLEISDELEEIIYGELLGDASVQISSSISARYTQSNKHKEYIFWLFDLLSSFGLEWNRKTKGYRTEKGGIGFPAKTYSYPELMDIRKKWYPNGKKIVPEDIRLTPTVVKHWYYGDGWFSDSRGILGSIGFATNGFTFEDVELLIKKLRKIDMKATIACDESGGYTIRIAETYSVRNFFTYIGSCDKEIANIYGYKFISPQTNLREFSWSFRSSCPHYKLRK